MERNGDLKVGVDLVIIKVIDLLDFGLHSTGNYVKQNNSESDSERGILHTFSYM